MARRTISRNEAPLAVGEPFLTEYEARFSAHWESKNRFLAGDWSYNAPSEARESLKIRYTLTSPNEAEIKEDLAERRAKGARRVTEMKQNEREVQRKNREKSDGGLIWP